jgi:putative NIF3 family GTP cyclohydrolase 1 type 2
MRRRDFLLTASLASVALNINAGKRDTEINTAGDLQNYLRSLYRIPEPSVDRIVIGDPSTRIRKAGTCWMPYLKTLKEAVSMGINVMVVHEPAFYRHWDLDTNGEAMFSTPLPARDQYMEAVEAKKSFIEENGLVIIRSHDVPDLIKSFGMPFAFGRKLGLNDEDIIGSKDYYNVYRIERARASEVARRIAERLKDYNQPGVAFYGEEDKYVSSIGIGTGYACDPQYYAELNPDMCIAIDDTIRTWIQVPYSEDTGKPLVVIHHGTSEEAGMELLNEHLGANIPSIEFVHFRQGCGYKWIT